MFNLQKAIIPTPVEVKDFGKCVKIAEISSPDCTFKYEGEGEVFEEAVALMKQIFEEKAAVSDTNGKYEISLIICDENIKKEGYIIDITEEKAILKAGDAAGAYYAAATFEQIIHNVDKDVLLPVCHIEDYPKFEKRGHFMECRYGSDFMTFDDWKQGIDYLSKMKVNKIVVGLYGCWGHHYDNRFAEYLYMPFKKHPELKTPRHIKYYSVKEGKMIYKKDVLPTMFEDNYFGKLVAYGKRKNIEVIPLINSLGHNTLIPRTFPEISAVGEDGKNVGLGFCTNNPKTLEIMFELYDEIIDNYLMPNGIKSFHVGLDEVWALLGMDHSDMQKVTEPFCKCEKCRDREYGELMRDYIIKIAKHMQEKGIENLFVYDDMLRARGILTKETAELFKKEGVYDTIVIDWWAYDMPESMNERYAPKTNDYFRCIFKPMTGYFHWNLPTHMNPNIYAMTALAEKNNTEGIIAYSSFEYCYDFNYRVLAEAAWQGTSAASVDELISRYASAYFPENTAGAIEAIKTTQQFTLGRFSRTNHIASFFEFYSYNNLRKDMEYPQDYPAKAFRRLRDEEDLYLPYLKDVYNKALSSYKFFSENTNSKTGDIWKLITLSYLSQSDEFISLYTCQKQYDSGIIDEQIFAKELERLIKNREKTIALCEDVRIKANQYICIRNMTVTLFAMKDLLAHIKNEIKEGKKPEIDVFEFGKYLSDLSWFLR